MGKKSSAPAPTPDPLVGQAAMQNIALSKEWLDQSKAQFAAGEKRQDVTDALTGRVTDAALASQAQADKWALEDRAIAADYRQKYDGWANEDRQLGHDTMGKLDVLGERALADSDKYGAAFDKEAGAQSKFGAEERGRYDKLFRPVQDRIVNDAMTWDSDARLESEAAKAKADVTAGAAQQREAGRRSMASMGINPASGRFAGVERATDTATALAGAGAQNGARDMVRQQGIQLRGQAAQLGQQVVGNGQQATSLGLQATGAGQTARASGIGTALQAKTAGLAASGIGNTAASMGMSTQGAGYAGLGTGLSAGGAAVGATQAGNGSFFQNGAGINAGYGGAMQGYSNAGNMLNNQYGNQLNAWGMQQQANGAAAGGIGSLVGTAIGAGTALYL